MVHRGTYLVEPVLEEVAVDVEGHRSRGVAQHLLDDFDVGAGGDGEAGGGLPQLVGMQLGHADRQGRGLE
ncbi:MAG: hypothetical protein WAV00_15085 [Nocardioides sp.]